MGHNYMRHDYIGNNYLGHNCSGHNYLGHNCSGHNYLGHNYTGHNYLGHNYLGHVSWVGLGPSAVSPSKGLRDEKSKKNIRHDCIGNNYIGHNYVGHNYIGPNYSGPNYSGHNYLGHNCLGHNYLCHVSWVGQGPSAVSPSRCSGMSHQKKNRSGARPRVDISDRPWPWLSQPARRLRLAEQHLGDRRPALGQIDSRSSILACL